MAELADAPDLGSGVLDVQVQVLLSALNENREIPEMETFPGSFCILHRSGGTKEVASRKSIFFSCLSCFFIRYWGSALPHRTETGGLKNDREEDKICNIRAVDELL